MTTSDSHRAIEAVWRIESAKLIASLARIVRDVGLAEDLAQDALVIALEQWPETGIPNKPGAWLMATAKHRACGRARVGLSGEPILLLNQNRVRWDQLLIRRGLAALARAEALGSALGPYALQAEIAACHARAHTPEETDWARIAALYDALAQLTPSPVVELNRAVAVSMAYGPAAGLELVEALTSEPSLKNYHLLPSVRGDLLAKLGRFDEARAEFERAAALTRNARERELLLERARAAGL